MPVFASILISVSVVSLISFIGVLFFSFQKNVLEKLLGILISFASGAMLGGAFFHLLPESVENLGENSFVLVVISFLLFFVLEKFFYWRHCHEKDCEVHAFTYLNLIGDGLHNLIDGAVIAASFLTDLSLGISTTLAIILHEVPQEIGDFSILIYGGLKRRQALFFNFLSALTAVLGALGVYFFAEQISNLVPFLLPMAAGGFIYIAATDLIPELHKRSQGAEAITHVVSLVIGVGLMWLIRSFS